MQVVSRLHLHTLSRPLPPSRAVAPSRKCQKPPMSAASSRAYDDDDPKRLWAPVTLEEIAKQKQRQQQLQLELQHKELTEPDAVHDLPPEHHNQRRNKHRPKLASITRATKASGTRSPQEFKLTGRHESVLKTTASTQPADAPRVHAHLSTPYLASQPPPASVRRVRARPRTVDLVSLHSAPGFFNKFRSRDVFLRLQNKYTSSWSSRKTLLVGGIWCHKTCQINHLGPP